MLRKLMIVPYAGEWPEWFPAYLAGIRHLAPLGYTFYFPPASLVEQRLWNQTGLRVSLVGKKLCDVRPLFGRLFEFEIEVGKFDFWGFTDLDCVYGRVEKWVTDEFLAELDVHSNHHSYVCGPWTLFRTGTTENL